MTEAPAVTRPSPSPPTCCPPTDGSAPAPPRCAPSRSSYLASLGRTVLGTSHRQAPVKNLVGEVRAGLRDLFGLPEGYEVVLGNGGSTAFWDIAAFGLVRERAQHLAFGEFSSKFGNVTAERAVPRRPDDRQGRARHARRRRAPRPASTSTPGRTTRPRPASWPRSSGSRAPTTTRSCSSTPPPAPAACPSTSAEADVYYFAPQKCFASDGGLWLAAFSPAALARVERDRRHPAAGCPTSSACRPRSTTRRKNQTYNTPALAHARPARRPGRAGSTATAASTGPPPAPRTPRAGSTTGPRRRLRRRRTSPTRPHRSQVVGTIDFDDAIDAAAVAKTLRANGIVDVEPYRKLGRNQLRVAMFPAVDPDDVTKLTQAIDHVVSALG